MLRLVIAGADSTITSALCASCPYSPAGCCTAPPRLDWSDIARIARHGGRDWLLAEIAAGRIVRGERWLNLRRKKKILRVRGPREAACVYHGPQGCTIAHDRRPATCNYYVCEEALAKDARSGGKGPDPRDAHARLVTAFTRWDEALDRRVDAEWPDGPTFDAAFLDWLCAAFAELANRGVSVVSSASAIDPGWHEVILQMDLHHDPSAVLATLAGNGLRISVFEPVRASLADLIEGVVKRGEGRRA